MTLSIVARNPETGSLGVATTTNWFDVRRTVPWVRSQVGAIATQALTDPSYGWRGLDMLEAGGDPTAVLAQLVAGDPDRERRQVAILAADGSVAVHSGTLAVPEVGHRMGEGWAIVGNFLVTTASLDAMEQAFVSAEGRFAERLLAALEAGVEVGGDVRGHRSAAVLIRHPGFSPDPRVGLDLAVADHVSPVAELRRLLALHRAFAEAARVLVPGAEPIEAGDDEFAPAEIRLWRAVSMARKGELDEAAAILASLIAWEPNTRSVLERLARVDPDVEIVLERL